MRLQKVKARERFQHPQANSQNTEFFDTPIIAQTLRLGTTRLEKNPRGQFCGAIDRLLARALARALFELPYTAEIKEARRLATLIEGRTA